MSHGKSHAAADVHDEGDALRMSLPAKGKAIGLAPAHVHCLASRDSILGMALGTAKPLRQVATKRFSSNSPLV